VTKGLILHSPRVSTCAASTLDTWLFFSQNITVKRDTNYYQYSGYSFAWLRIRWWDGKTDSTNCSSVNTVFGCGWKVSLWDSHISLEFRNCKFSLPSISEGDCRVICIIQAHFSQRTASIGSYTLHSQLGSEWLSQKWRKSKKARGEPQLHLFPTSQNRKKTITSAKVTYVVVNHLF
jgi:hypothetical protein